MARDRTFKVKSPYMRGDDIESWQEFLNRVLASWNVDLKIKTDGVYGMGTRSVSKMVCYGLGFTHAQLDSGITAWVRVRARNPEMRSRDQKERIANRMAFRNHLREKFRDRDLAAPLSKILVMTWGWHPGVHDGIDLICGPSAPLYAICDAKVIDVRASGWWGNAPSGDVWKGDGIIQLECLTDEGPFKRGYHIGYGHAEGADVKVGQRVEAGTRIGEAGLAVAWHVHFMVNDGRVPTTSAGVPAGIGTMDPEPFVRYALEHAR